MRKILICTFPLLALAACNSSVKLSDAEGGDGNASDSNVHIAMNEGNKVSVDVPGFSAKLALPSMNLGGHLDLDGIKVAPNTKVTTLDVTAHDDAGNQDDGKVNIRFTNPAPAAAVIDHYARATADAGYGDIARTPTSLTARKEQKTFAVNVSPQGTGSQGTILIAGKD
ncbi:hypothetical protein [Sphingomonas crusticola]|uniref:hypothetical protein n=1 Tax=Sphingomonas crusticola TaxID=1697973 RepID=UPI000E28831C|nr:hypothetical protein [Sphingomonas crusticola]